ASSAFPESHFCFPHSQPRSTPRVRANRVWRASDSKGGARRIDSSPRALQGSTAGGLPLLSLLSSTGIPPSPHHRSSPLFLRRPTTTCRYLAAIDVVEDEKERLASQQPLHTALQRGEVGQTTGITCQGLEDLPGDLHHIEASAGADPDHVLEALGGPDVVVDVLGQGRLAQPRHAVDGHNVRPSRPSQVDDAPEQLQPVHGGKGRDAYVRRLHVAVVGHAVTLSRPSSTPLS
ncbi:hypothetical protein Taro_016186, partial [Colocasia esculenta]|nr:hypothetical protein [Colocasia esculenta]